MKYVDHRHRLLEELHSECKRRGIEPADIRNSAKGPTKKKVALTRKIAEVHHELAQKSTLYGPEFQADAFGIQASLIRSRISAYLNNV